MSDLQMSFAKLSEVQRRRLLYSETRRPIFNEFLVMKLLMMIDQPHKGFQDGANYLPSPFVCALKTPKIFHHENPEQLEQVHELVCKMDGPVENEEGKLDSWLRLGLEVPQLSQCFFKFQGPQKEVLAHALQKHHDHIGFNLVPYTVITEYASTRKLDFMLNWLQINAPLMPDSSKREPWFTLFHFGLPLVKEVIHECVRQGMDINALHEISAKSLNTPVLHGITAPDPATGVAPKMFCSLLGYAYIMGMTSTTHMTLACGADPDAVVFRMEESSTEPRQEFRFKEWMDFTAWPGDTEIRSTTEDILICMDRSAQANDLLKEMISESPDLVSSRKASI